MFISNKEKADLHERISLLEKDVAAALRSIVALQDKEPASKEKANAKRNAYARAYYQRKKYEKLVAEHKA